MLLENSANLLKSHFFSSKVFFSKVSKHIQKVWIWKIYINLKWLYQDVHKKIELFISKVYNKGSF